MRARIVVVLIICMLSTSSSLAISEAALHAIQYDSVFQSDDITAGTGTSCTTQGSSTLEGHTLPATKGGTGVEEAIDDQGRVASTGGRVSFSQNAKLGQEYRDFYITMRWRYAKWNWNGTTVKGEEDSGFYAKAPRILVTNQRTGKSIIAVVMEAGPAPWTGVDRSSSNAPKQGWVNPQDGTPAAYRGRVAGFPPKAIQALGAAQRMSDGSGDDLLYSWAPDQKATPGPTSLAAADTGSCAAKAGVAVQTIAGATINLAFPTKKDLITPTAVVLHYTATTPDVNSTINALRSNQSCGAGGCSVQLTIDGQGVTYQLVQPLNVLTDHAKGINNQAIGIEIGGLNESQLVANDTQFKAVVDTIEKLMQTFSIPLVADIEGRKGILSHEMTDKSSYGGHSGKVDPGPKYYQRVIDELRKRGNK